MKLFRAQGATGVVPGVMDAQGVPRSLAGHITDITVTTLSQLESLRTLELGKLPEIKAPLHYLTPLHGIRQIIAAGLNYRQHAMEATMPIPVEPILFSKPISSLSGPNDDIVLPHANGVLSTATDYEAELAVIISRDCYQVSVDAALTFVAGYAVANDVSERDYQLKRGASQWIKGKCSPSFTPIGPWFVTADEVPDPQSLAISLQVNGEQRQSSNTRDMIFSVAELISHASQFMRLLQGDVILTGTPQGVGMGFKPPRYLRTGDRVQVKIEGLGEQQQQVV